MGGQRVGPAQPGGVFRFALALGCLQAPRFPSSPGPRCGALPARVRRGVGGRRRAGVWARPPPSWDPVGTRERVRGPGSAAGRPTAGARPPPALPGAALGGRPLLSGPRREASPPPPPSPCPLVCRRNRYRVTAPLGRPGPGAAGPRERTGAVPRGRVALLSFLWPLVPLCAVFCQQRVGEAPKWPIEALPPCGKGRRAFRTLPSGLAFSTALQRRPWALVRARSQPLSPRGPGWFCTITLCESAMCKRLHPFSMQPGLANDSPPFPSSFYVSDRF